MVDEPASDSFIDDLADDFLRRHRRGERPRIAEYLEKYPEHADQIREVFPALVMLESLASSDAPGKKYSLLSGIRRPEVLGDYRILQEVGQGGMGIVYEAEQISLGRHVALKVLPFQLAGNSQAVERFQREARAAANLQHPNIVPVFDYKQEDSVWFYAMQFVHGQPLSEVLQEVCKLRSEDAIELDRWAGQTTDLAITLLDGEAPVQSASTVSISTDGATSSASSEKDSTTQREQRIRAVVDDCLQRRENGEQVNDEEILSQHPELLPELSEELRMVRLVQASRLPSFVEDLAAMEARWAPPDESDDEASPAEPMERPSSVVSLTGEHDLRPSSRKRFYFDSVARLGSAVAGALVYAHEQGVIHRDIKPSNLMLDTRGHVWVTDFGLAKLSRTEGTSTGGLVGTLRYMSPEQIQGKSDEQSDVYGLGMTLYEMLTLTPPFANANYLDTIQRICHHGPPPPREIDPAIPRDLETIVLKAIARNREDRYDSARALADDLIRYLAQKPISAKRSSLLTRAWRWMHRHLATWIGGTMHADAASTSNLDEVAKLRGRIVELEAEVSRLKSQIQDAEQSPGGDHTL